MASTRDSGRVTTDAGPAGVSVAVGRDIQAVFEKDAPWYTSGAIEFLDSIDFSRLVGLEYGGGGSSLWWARRLDALFTVEANVKWALAIMHNFRQSPELLAKWRLSLVPANWHHRENGALKLKNEWQRNPELITPERVEQLEADYLRPPTDRADVVMIDGAIRRETVEMFGDWVSNRRVRYIVVDNTESDHTSEACSRVFHNYHRYDFWESDSSLIPTGQLSWMTTIFTLD